MGANMQKGTLACCFAVLVGLVSMGVWTNVVGYGEAFLPPGSDGASTSSIRVSYYVGRLAVCVALLAAPRFVDRAEASLKAGVPLFVACMTAILLLAHHQTLVEPRVLGCVAAFCMGVGYIWVVACMYLGLAASVDLRAALLLTAVAQVLEQVASTAVSAFVPDGFQSVLCVALPLVLFVPFYMLGRLRTEGNQEDCPPVDRAVYRYQMVLAVAAGVAIVALASVSNVGLWGSARSDYGFDVVTASMFQALVAGAVVLAATYACLLPAQGRCLEHRYQNAFLLIVAVLMGAVALRGAGMSGRLVTGALLLAGEYFAHVLVWAVTMEAAGQAGVPRYRTVGIGIGANALFSLLLLLFDALNNAVLDAVVVTVSYAVVVAVTVLPRRLMTDREAKNPGARPAGTDDEDTGQAGLLGAVERRCKDIAGNFGLSARETDVLVLLAQGRSRPWIQAKLVLSEGTVKTHVSHIFAKTGVSSTQELLELVYGR